MVYERTVKIMSSIFLVLWLWLWLWLCMFCGVNVSGVGGDTASETVREETDNSSLWPPQEVLTATNTLCNSL